MDSSTLKHLHEHIDEKAELITDSNGDELKIINNENAVYIAKFFTCNVKDVYIEALKSKIYPLRYIRNRNTISIKEQIKLAESKIAVVGSGGLGGHIILSLARVGIGELIVIDYDLFDETNLNRQAISNIDNIGMPKSDEAVKIISSINPGVTVKSFKSKIDSNNAINMLYGLDAIVDALDNVPDRFVLENIAKKLEIPVVHGAVAGFEGHVMTIFPEDSGLSLIYGNETNYKNNIKKPENILGVPALTPCMIATLQAMEVIKIILNKGNLFRNIMLHADLESGKLNEFTFM